LYRQVRDTLVRRIAAGTWPPGQALPSEHRLAEELKVSQGTVRKALDTMARENLLIRRQGLGTFVADYSEERTVFNFFRLAPSDGPRLYPSSEVLSCTTAKPNQQEQRRLGLSANEKAVRIMRVRKIDGRSIILEKIVLSQSMFPGINEISLPDKMYGLYSTRYGIRVDTADEHLKAVAASSTVADILGIAAGTPLLRIDRIAFSLDKTPIEWRLSLCITDNLHYESHLK
jgi:GntR family transcriptional regulator